MDAMVHAFWKIVSYREFDHKGFFNRVAQPMRFDFLSWAQGGMATCEEFAALSGLG